MLTYNDLHKTGSFGFDDKCKMIYSVSRVPEQAARFRLLKRKRRPGFPDRPKTRQTVGAAKFCRRAVVGAAASRIAVAVRCRPRVGRRVSISAECSHPPMPSSREQPNVDSESRIGQLRRSISSATASASNRSLLSTENSNSCIPLSQMGNVVGSRTTL